ncbi:MAG: DUF72 domain-containing protein [Euryarchaeota archaeon]|nr:DUF72 domain-containing protein [Euryarchaeota archaeon]
MARVGTCGFPVARKKYYSEFSVVEVQKTFYSPMSPKLAEKWRNEAPEHFEFAVKAPQCITHKPKSPTYRRYRGTIGDFGSFKTNKDVLNCWEQFAEVARTLKARIVVFQSPPSFEESAENVKHILDFFSVIERDFIYAWEPRGRWRDVTIIKICSDAELIHVVDPFLRKRVYGEFGYYRLHGMGKYRYSYSTEELQKLKNMVEKDDYVMFNNTDMWNNALMFRELLEEAPPHKWHNPQL